jgi:spore germination protein GerM
MKSSLQQSGMVEFVTSYLENRTNEKSTTRFTNLYFPIPNLKDNSLTLNPYQTKIESSLYRHNKIERVLKGPTKEALSEGAINIFPVNTTLIGLTVSQQVAYIDFSKEFLDVNEWDEDLSYRIKIINETLKSDNDIKKVIILVEKEILDY